MGVAVVVVAVAAARTAGHFFYGDDAAVGLRAAGVLELDGAVADVEVVFENVFEVDENAGALGRRDVVDDDVAGECARLRSKAPDMEVGDIEHAFNGFHAGANVTQRAAARRTLKKDVERLANDADAGP